MTDSFLDGQYAPWNGGALAWAEPTPALNVVLLYQDTLTQEWAWQKQQRLAKPVSERKFRCAGWNLRDLNGARVFADAVTAALEAELIVVSVSGAKHLPLAFYAWASSWLPYRCHKAGTLALLLGLPRAGGSRPRHQVREQLAVIARQAGMEFALEQRRLPVTACEVAPAKRQQSRLGFCQELIG